MQILTLNDATGGRRDYVKYALAVAYTAHLMGILSPAEFELAVFKNEMHGARHVNHFHDNCDANQVLLDAVYSAFPNERKDDLDNWVLNTPVGKMLCDEVVQLTQLLAKEALIQ